MAQVFPLNAPAGERDPTLSLLLDTLAGLPDPWTLLAERVIGEGEAVGAVLVHPDIGVALVDVAPADVGSAVAALGALLARERFAEFFPGELPMVTVSVTAEEIPAIGERLAEAFEAAPRLSVADRDWSDAVIELLLVPGDMAMAPTGGQAAALLDAATPPLRPTAEPAPPFATLNAPSFADGPPPSMAEMQGGAPPLHADWRMAVGYQPPRRHWALVATATAVLLLGGVAGLGLAVESGTFPPAPVASRSRSIEVPLAPAEASDHISGPTAPAVANRPPPVPAAPPVMLAAKPLVAPPPAAPKPTRVAALPPPRRIAEEKPPAPPPTTAAPVAAPPPAPVAPRTVDKLPTVPAAPLQTADKKPPPIVAPPRTVENKPTAPPAPPARVAAKPRPTAPKPQVATAASHPPPRAPRASARAAAPVLRPPIDAADLPPLDESAPKADESAPKPVAAFSPPTPLRPSPPPPAPQPAAAAPIPLAPAIGPPRRFTRAPSPVEQEAAGGRRECRPYTANSTLAGNGIAVQGIACRDGDGQWRLVSEVPLR